MGGEKRLLGIVLDLDASGTIRGARLAEDSLARVKGAANSAGDASIKNSMNVANAAKRTFANVAAVGVPMMMAGRKGVEFFKSTVTSAGDLENALGQVKLVMGLVGKAADNKKLLGEFEQIRKKIIQIGRDTEFSTSQAASGFYMLKSAGLKTQQAMQMIDQTMAFVSASRGQIDLAEGTKITGLVMNKFGMNVKDAKLALDSLVMLTATTDVQFRDMQQMLMSLGAAASKLAKTDFQQMMALAGGLKTMGLSAAQATNYIQGFSSTLDQTLRVAEGMSKRGYAKRKAMRLLGLSKSDFVDATGNYKGILDIITMLQGKLSRFQPYMRGVLLQMLFGNKTATVMVELAAKFQKQQGKTLKTFAEELKTAGGMAIAGQKDYLKSWKGILQVWKGSVDLFKSSIGKVFLPTLKPLLEWLTKLINSFVAWGKQNPILFKTIVSIVLALVLFAKIAGTLMTSISALALIVLGFGGASATATPGVLGLSAAMSTLWAAMAPMLILIAQILAVIVLLVAAFAAGYYLAKNWSKIWKWMKDVFWKAVNSIVAGVKWLWAKIANTFDRIYTYVTSIPSRIMSGLETGFDNIVSFFGGLGSRIWNAISNGLSNMWTNLKSWVSSLWKSMYDAGAGIMREIGRGIAAMAYWPIEKAMWVAKKIKGLWPFSPAEEGPLVDIHKGGQGLLKQISYGLDLQKGPFLSSIARIAEDVRNAFGFGPTTEAPVGETTGGMLSDLVPTGPFMGSAPASRGDVYVTIPTMNFYATRMSSTEAEEFSNVILRKVAQKIKEAKERGFKR